MPCDTGVSGGFGWADGLDWRTGRSCSGLVRHRERGLEEEEDEVDEEDVGVIEAFQVRGSNRGD